MQDTPNPEADMPATLPPVENPAKVRRDSRKALRQAWPHRHTSFRAPMVIRANVKMLRRLDQQENA